MIKRISLFLLLLSFLMLNACSDSDGDSVQPLDKFTRSTQFGDVRGISYANNTIAWLGIPYAKPPTQENGLRWRAPQDPDPWPGVLESLASTDECVACSQMGLKPVTRFWEKTGPVGSEDCLILAIWRPDTDETDLPVYFWLHGGSNNLYGIGLADQPGFWDGSALAQRSNMVVVAAQHRLGILGWLSHPALRNGDEAEDSGNFGTLDTIKALEWVQNNISGFGGDPENVLVAGMSSGAHNAMNLMLSPLADGLFHKLLYESGGMKLRTVETGEADAEAFIDRLLEIDGLPDVPGGDIKAYLESKTADELVNGFWNLKTAPGNSSAFRDGYVIPDSTTADTLASGQYNHVPVIIGCNADEVKMNETLMGLPVKYAYMTPSYGVTEPVPSGSYTWIDQFRVLVPEVVAGSKVVTPNDVTLEDIFPLQTDLDLYQACNAYGSLNWRVNFVDDLARALRSHSDQPVYAYLLQWDGMEGTPYQFSIGAAHGTDVPFFFGHDESLYYGAGFSPDKDTPGRKALSEAMMKYVADFAATGNPNGGSLPIWEEWSPQSGGPKRILWDATEDAINIRMGTEEYTPDDVKALFKSIYVSLPESTRNIMFWFNFWPES